MKAAEKGHTAIVHLLILQGANVNAANTVRNVCLFCADSTVLLNVLCVLKREFCTDRRDGSAPGGKSRQHRDCESTADEFEH